MALRLLRKGRHEPPASPRLMALVSLLSKTLKSDRDLDPLLDRIGDARYVLFGRRRMAPTSSMLGSQPSVDA